MIEYRPKGEPRLRLDSIRREQLSQKAEKCLDDRPKILGGQHTENMGCALVSCWGRSFRAIWVRLLQFSARIIRHTGSKSSLPHRECSGNWGE
jgi:hypothetical protein